MEEALAVNKEFISLFISLIGWGGFIIVCLIFRDFIVAALSNAAAWFLLQADKKTQERLIVHLVNKKMTLRELYRELKNDFEEKEEVAK
ncbi:MAG: hypothetical protein Q8Q06_02100 [bacterium]|nr:hypothetical protein [bacterium]